MDKIWLLSWITFKDSIRSKALHGIFLFALLLFSANIIITSMFSWELGKVAVDVGLSSVSLSGLLLIFFFSINIFSNDLEHKTIYLILSRPISRIQYVIGKYAGLSLVILVSSTVLGVCSAISIKVAAINSSGYIPANFSWNLFFLALIFLTFSLLLLMATAFFWVSVTSHPFLAVLLSIFTYFIGQNIETVKKLVFGMGFLAENRSLSQFLDYASWVFPNLGAFDLKSTAAYGLSINGPYLGWLCGYGIAYTGIILFFTIIVFRRRELG